MHQQMRQGHSQREDAQSYLMHIAIKTVNQENHEARIPRQVQGSEIKRYIYDRICQNLQVEQMSLHHSDGSQIQDFQSILAAYIDAEKPFPIEQRSKMKSKNVSITKNSSPPKSSIIDYFRIDPYSYERGVITMSCGHVIGKTSMKCKIRALIDCKKYDIRCGYQNEQTGGQCQASWTFKQCKQTTFLSSQETQLFEEGLSQNWMFQNCKTCPKCQHKIFKPDLDTNCVYCPNCQSEAICYICLKEWKGFLNCNSEQCAFLHKTVQNSPWNRVFTLFDRQTNTLKDYETPQYRSCPRCKTIIEHAQLCKHINCRHCGVNFCWVCLSLANRTQKWECGEAKDFCGSIAQAQKFTNQ